MGSVLAIAVTDKEENVMSGRELEERRAGAGIWEDPR